MKSDSTLQLGAGQCFILDSAYDDFERIVLMKNDTEGGSKWT